MRQGRALSVCLIMLTLLLAAPLFADNVTENLQSMIIDRFDAPSSGSDANSKYDYPENHKWIVRGSKFIAQGFPKFSWVKTSPAALAAILPNGSDLASLGVEAAFDRPGYNYLEFVPVADQNAADGSPVESGIPIPGRAKALDFWVWGSNYNFYMEIQLRDWQGIVHVLNVGDLNFKGWRDLQVDIPGSIPQGVKYAQSLKGLQLVKIVLWTRPDEKVNDFFVYFDHMKVLTDMFETPFDGSDLANQSNVDKLWASGTSTQTK